MISTDYQSDATQLAARIFARLSQENFFKYMRENFSLDRLIEYGVEKSAPETIKIVNPKYRRYIRKCAKHKENSIANWQRSVL